MIALASEVEFESIIPDWVFDNLEDRTPKRKHWITKGLGSGGTFGSAIWHLTRCEENRHSASSWVIAPIYTQIRDPIIPTFVAVMNTFFQMNPGTDYSLIQSGTPRIVLKRINGKKTSHTIFFKSANKPEMFVGANISHYTMTEPGLIDEVAFRKANDRLRCPKAKVLQATLEGTPEGMGNFYEKHANFEGEIDPHRNYKRTILWTADNPHLKEVDYVSDVEKNYAHDPARLESYLYGRFVPFTKGNAYWEFAYSKNVKLNLVPSEHTDLTITFDWNHTPLAWVAWQEKSVWTKSADRYARYEVLGESSGRSKGILDACAEFIAQFPPEKFRDTPIKVDGAADGYNRSHLASLCAFDQVMQILRKYYINVSCVAERKAPAIKDRLQRHNALLAYGYLVVAAWCRNTIRAHEQTNLKENSWETEKPQGENWTHWGEALGYSIFRTTKGLNLDSNNGKTKKTYGIN